MNGIKLSEIVVDGSEDLERVLGKPVVDAMGRQVGIIETAYFGADDTVNRVVIKTREGLRVMVKARNLLLLNGGEVAWIAPEDDALSALREALRALLELLELHAKRGGSPQSREALVKAACEHLNNAIRLLQQPRGE